MEVKGLILEYLSEAKLMQVATCKEGQPWACSVYFVSDDGFNLYWLSKRSRRHSKELMENPKVAGTIVLPHTPGQKVRGIQFQGEAQEVTGEELAVAHTLYAARYDRSNEVLENAKKPGDEQHAYYRVKPSRIVLFDEVNFPNQPRQEMGLV